MATNGPIEVALSTDLRGEPYSFSLWDIHTGAQLVAFKGNKGSPISRCLQLIDHNYFITAIDNVLQIWSIYNRKSQDQKLFLPGRPSALATSPCGHYLIVGISEMLYIWQFNSGNLLAHTQRHYQTITVLKVSQDGAFLFSGGEDGVVMVWPFADLISNSHNTGALGISESRADMGVNEPRFSWQHHSSKVTDIHVANSGLCITSSCDKSINIYNYTSGKRLHCIADWPSPISSIVMNKNETRLFLGAHDGNIYELAISSLSLSMINSREKDENGGRSPILKGHKDKINQLLLSMDGTMLISGSNDSTCKIWDVLSGKMLRDVKHQAPLANIISFLVPDGFALTSMTQSHVKPPFLVKPLKRNLHKLPRDTSILKSELFEEASTTIVGLKNRVDLFELHRRQITPKVNNETSDKTSSQTCEEPNIVNVTHKSDDVIKLKSRLRELYLISAEKIFRDAADPLAPYNDLVEDTYLKKKAKRRKAGNSFI